MLDLGVSKRYATLAIAALVFIWFARFTVVNLYESDTTPTTPTPFLESEPDIISKPGTVSKPDTIPKTPEKKHGKITDRVATITDTQYTDRLLPLIMHFHAVLGPDWPIVFFTSNETLHKYILPQLSPSSESSPSLSSPSSPAPTPAKVLSPGSGSAALRRAVSSGAIDIRVIPDQFDLSSRDGVNIFLSRPWLYEQLAPATHMLVFQADAMICANSPRLPDDFFQYDWIGAPLHTRTHYYNGGLCLRNRTMIMDILSDGSLWEMDTLVHKNWTEGGEDIWFSKKMDLRGANLPSADVAMRFAAEHSWHVKPSVKGKGLAKEYELRPWGFHKVHVYAKDKLEEISMWCPEISLAAKGRLEPST